MNNIELILKKIQKNMDTTGTTKLTVALVYDNIVKVYSKLSTSNQLIYNCYRKSIIEEITYFYDKNYKDKELFIKKVLTRFIQECNNIGI